MKFILTLVISAEGSRLGNRRYDQLKDMMLFYDSSYDEKKTWSYGCNCHALGDRLVLFRLHFYAKH